MDETSQPSDSPSSSDAVDIEKQSNENEASQTDKASDEGSPIAAGSEKQNEITEIDCSNEVIEVTEGSFEIDDDDDSEIEILDAAAFREQQQQQQATAAATTTTTTNDGEDSDEDLQCVGTANETKLPHNRQDCLAFRYKTSNNNNNPNGSSICAETTSENAKFCALCYCYVCDKPAAECESWYLGQKGVSEDSKQSASSDNTNDSSLKHHQNHCNAVDKGSMKNLWKNMRTALKNGQDPSTVSTAAPPSSSADDSLSQFFARYTAPPAAAAASSSTMAAAASAMTAALAEHIRRRERHRYRAHATGRGGAHQRRSSSSSRGEGRGNSSSIYGSVAMEAANNMDFTAATTSSSSSSSSRRSGTSRQERRRRRPTTTGGNNNNNEQRSRHSNHRDRMRTQAILEDLYS